MNLNAIEMRVLGSLLEKSLATPNAYPLSLNALTLACNQQTSREPVTDFSDDLVLESLGELREKRLVVQHVGGRATKFSQTLSLMADITPQQLACLAVLMLRGPQTVGDLRQRTERMANFADLAAVQQALDALAARLPPLAAAMPRRPGEKEARITQLVSDEQIVAALLAVDAPEVLEALVAKDATSAPSKTPTQLRIDALEADLAALREEFAQFRRQFE